MEERKYPWRPIICSAFPCFPQEVTGLSAQTMKLLGAKMFKGALVLAHVPPEDTADKFGLQTGAKVMLLGCTIRSFQSIVSVTRVEAALRYAFRMALCHQLPCLFSCLCAITLEVTHNAAGSRQSEVEALQHAKAAEPRLRMAGFEHEALMAAQRRRTARPVAPPTGAVLGHVFERGNDGPFFAPTWEICRLAEASACRAAALLVGTYLTSTMCLRTPFTFHDYQVLPERPGVFPPPKEALKLLHSSICGACGDRKSVAWMASAVDSHKEIF
eukprot:scaffold114975_cov19-Tisochrysis_lutea.AAC.1